MVREASAYAGSRFYGTLDSSSRPSNQAFDREVEWSLLTSLDRGVRREFSSETDGFLTTGHYNLAAIHDEDFIALMSNLGYK